MLGHFKSKYFDKLHCFMSLNMEISALLVNLLVAKFSPYEIFSGIHVLGNLALYSVVHL